MQGATQGRDTTITNRITCAFCGLTGHPDCSKESCRLGVNSGTPVVLTDANGQAVYAPQREEGKAPYDGGAEGSPAGEDNVHGKLVKRDGVRGIYVSSMEKAT